MPFGDAVERGLAALGPAETGGDWLWLLSDATAPEPRALERLLSAVEVAPSVADIRHGRDPVIARAAELLRARLKR